MEDQYEKFQTINRINSIDDITEIKVKKLNNNFRINRFQNDVSIYCLEINSEGIPEITFFMKVFDSMSVKIFLSLKY